LPNLSIKKERLGSLFEVINETTNYKLLRIYKYEKCNYDQKRKTWKVFLDDYCGLF